MKWTCKGHTYKRPECQMHSFRTQFLVLMSAGIVAKLHPINWSCIPLWVISYKFFQYFENTFFRTLVYDGFYKFKWERYTKHLLGILSKLVSFHVKLAIKCIQTSRKEKFHEQPVVILFKNDCSVRHMFRTTFAFLSLAKILEKHVRSRSYLV